MFAEPRYCIVCGVKLSPYSVSRCRQCWRNQAADKKKVSLEAYKNGAESRDLRKAKRALVHVKKYLKGTLDTPKVPSGRDDQRLATCLACGGAMNNNGRDRHSRQRLKCSQCGVTVTSGVRRLHGRKTVAAMDQIGKLVRDGWGIREICVEVGLAKETVMSARKRLFADGMPRCQCGLEVGHKGHCFVRLARMPKESREGCYRGLEAGRRSRGTSPNTK